MKWVLGFGIRYFFMVSSAPTRCEETDLRVERGAARRTTRILRGFEQLPITLSPETMN